MSLPAEFEARVREWQAKLEGWCSIEKSLRMAELVLENKPKLCVELGVFGGASLIPVALALKEQGFGRIDGIDPYSPDAATEGQLADSDMKWWGDCPYGMVRDWAESAILNAGVTQHARIIVAKSADVVSSYGYGSIDYMHQDSNHSEVVSLAEARAWAPRVAHGGIWVFDDQDWTYQDKPTTKAAQDHLRDSGFKRIEDYGKWGVWKRL